MSYDDDEMRRHMLQAQAQNVYNQQSALGQQTCISPFTGPFGVVTGEKKSIEDKKRAWEDAQMRADSLRSEYEKALFKEPVKGPSPEQMTKYPSLKSLWEELKAGMLLCGIKDGLNK